MKAETQIIVRPKDSVLATHCGTTVLSYAAKGLSMDGMVVLRNRDWIRAIGGGSHRLA